MFRSFLFATIKRDVRYHLSFTFTMAFSWMFPLFKLPNRFCCSLNPKTHVVILDAEYMKLWDEVQSLFHKLFLLIFTSFLFYHFRLFYHFSFCWCILLPSSLSEFMKWDIFIVLHLVMIIIQIFLVFIITLWSMYSSAFIIIWNSEISHCHYYKSCFR